MDCLDSAISEFVSNWGECGSILAQKRPSRSSFCRAIFSGYFIKCIWSYTNRIFAAIADWKSIISSHTSCSVRGGNELRGASVVRLETY